MADCSKESEKPQNAETQTEELQYVFSSVPGHQELKSAETQTEELQFAVPTTHVPNKDFFKSDEKVRYYTGLPSYEGLMIVFDHVAPFVTRTSQSLDSFQECMLVLMKLRQNMPFLYLAYWFDVSPSIVSQIFDTWIVALDIRLSCFVFWPNREDLLRTMPMCFKYTFGEKVTAIIDCLEVSIDKPANLSAREQTFSSHMQRHTLKVLIGITPLGTMSFVSKAWGGCASNMFLAETSGFLDKLLPGDTVLVGGKNCDSNGLEQGEFVMGAFTKGEAQLELTDVEGFRGIDSVRTHVEKLIGLLSRKYKFLEGTVPIDHLVCDDSQVPPIDRIIRICSALVNLGPPVESSGSN